MSEPTGPSPELEALVRRTEGLQPARRLFHALSGSAAALVLTLWDPRRATAAAILGSVVLALVVLDLARLRSTRINTFFFRAFSRVASPREARRPVSSTWYALGLLLAVLLFPLHTAVSGILVLALADPAASYLGRRWGTRPFLGGSLEGTLAFVAVAAVVLSLRHSPAAALPAAVVASLAERRSWPLDDNLTVPLVTSGAVWLVEALL